MSAFVTLLKQLLQSCHLECYSTDQAIIDHDKNIIEMDIIERNLFNLR